MQTCYNCGKQVPDDTLICPDCGALVKRYSAPVRQEDPEQQAERAPQQDAAVPRGPIFRGADGRVRFSGAMTAWLIVCAVFAGYTALSYASLMIVYHNQALYSSFFSSVPELAELQTYYAALMQDISQYYGAYLAMLVLCLVHCGGCIWLLSAKRRAALWTAAGSALALAVMMAVSGNYAYTLLFVLGAAMLLLLRRGYSLLR